MADLSEWFCGSIFGFLFISFLCFFVVIFGFFFVLVFFTLLFCHAKYFIQYTNMINNLRNSSDRKLVWSVPYFLKLSDCQTVGIWILQIPVFLKRSPEGDRVEKAPERLMRKVSGSLRNVVRRTHTPPAARSLPSHSPIRLLAYCKYSTATSLECNDVSNRPMTNTDGGAFNRIQESVERNQNLSETSGNGHRKCQL